ncbi:MAG: T9SS type A sorting domain-containing protein [Candidatus Symbiothrix sp.]|jgi:hypothetical protein|nr:T9SS type A sorting domain-containing protein [Candidatus Symbiothrix sp.]
MKTKYLLTGLLLLASAAFISAQSIAFDYDADGNMESRYVVTLQSVKAAETETTETTEIAEIDLKDFHITIYPNPTKGQIRIIMEPFLPEQSKSLQLYDASGKLLKTQAIASATTALEITGNPGVYLLNIRLGETVSKWKIIKQ